MQVIDDNIEVIHCMYDLPLWMPEPTYLPLIAHVASARKTKNFCCFLDLVLLLDNQPMLALTK